MNNKNLFSLSLVYLSFLHFCFYFDTGPGCLTVYPLSVLTEFRSYRLVPPNLATNIHLKLCLKALKSQQSNPGYERKLAKSRIGHNFPKGLHWLQKTGKKKKKVSQHLALQTGDTGSHNLLGRELQKLILYFRLQIHRAKLNYKETSHHRKRNQI